MAGVTVEPEVWARRAPVVALGLAVTLLGMLRGPGMWADDWEWTRNRQFRGLAATVDHEWFTARPVAGTVITAIWAPFGDHPVLLYLVLAALNAAVAWLLYRVCLRWFSVQLASSVAIVWFVLPIRTSLRMWPSTVNIVIALGLALLVLHRQEERWSPVAALAAGLSYAAVCPAGAAAVLLRRDTTLRRRFEVVSAYSVGFGWSLLHPLYDIDVPTIDLRIVWSAHFGHGLAPGFGWAAGLVVLVGSAAVIRLGSREQRAAVAVGLATLIAGTMPFLRFMDYSTEGFADRSRVVSSIGAALILASILSSLPWKATAAACVAMTLVFIGQTGDYRASYDDTLAWADGATVGEIYTLRAPPDRDGVWSVGWWENATAAVQVLRDNPQLVAVPDRHAIEP